MRAGDEREPLAVDRTTSIGVNMPCSFIDAARAHVLEVEVADVAAGLDPLDGDLLHAARGHRGSGHKVLLHEARGPAGCGTGPSPTARASVLAVWEGPARIPARSPTGARARDSAALAPAERTW